jgi:hypothetical protein
MPNSTPVRQVEPELLQRLGLLVIRWAVIENWMSELFIFMMKGTPGLMYVVTESISQSTITEWIRTLLGVVQTPADIERELLDILNDVKELRGERNALVHGIWSTDCPPHSAIVQTVKLDRREMVRDQVVTAADIDDLISRTLEIHVRMVAIAKAVGMRTPD